MPYGFLSIPGCPFFQGSLRVPVDWMFLLQLSNFRSLFFQAVLVLEPVVPFSTAWHRCV